MLQSRAEHAASNSIWLVRLWLLSALILYKSPKSHCDKSVYHDTKSHVNRWSTVRCRVSRHRDNSRIAEPVVSEWPGLERIPLGTARTPVIITSAAAGCGNGEKRAFLWNTVRNCRYKSHVWVGYLPLTLVTTLRRLNIVCCSVRTDAYLVISFHSTTWDRSAVLYDQIVRMSGSPGQESLLLFLNGGYFSCYTLLFI